MSSVPGAFAENLRRYAPATRRLREAAQRYVDAAVERTAAVRAGGSPLTPHGLGPPPHCIGRYAAALQEALRLSDAASRPIGTMMSLVTALDVLHSPHSLAAARRSPRATRLRAPHQLLEMVRERCPDERCSHSAPLLHSVVMQTPPSSHSPPAFSSTERLSR